MAEVEYPSNSNKSKEASLIRDSAPSQSENRQIVKEVFAPDEPVATPKAVKTQRSLTPVHEVFKAIFPGGFTELKDHVIWDVFVPWAQDALHTGWDALGDVIFPGTTSKRTGSSPVEHTSYDSQYRVRNPQVSYDDYDQYGMTPYRTRQEAEDILNTLKAMCIRYGKVRLLDFNEAVGNQTKPTQQAYGWYSLDEAYVTRVTTGFVIKMPPAVPLDR